MKSKLLDDGPEKTWALIMDSGDEASSSLALFARAKKLRGSYLTAIGGYSRATLGYYDWETKTYLKIPIDEQGARTTTRSAFGAAGAGPTTPGRSALIDGRGRPPRRAPRWQAITSVAEHAREARPRPPLCC